jgi:hypothetical protein
MPDTVALAKQLHAHGLSYRKIAAELAARTPDGQREAACGVRNTEDAWGGRALKDVLLVILGGLITVAAENSRRADLPSGDPAAPIAGVRYKSLLGRSHDGKEYQSFGVNSAC